MARRSIAGVSRLQDRAGLLSLTVRKGVRLSPNRKHSCVRLGMAEHKKANPNDLFRGKLYGVRIRASYFERSALKSLLFTAFSLQVLSGTYILLRVCGFDLAILDQLPHSDFGVACVCVASSITSRIAWERWIGR